MTGRHTEYGSLDLPRLPIEDCLDDLLQALASQNSAVLVAPPGAGKTSRVPLALLSQSWNEGKRILVLEPRRLAARAAAEHMASLIGEKPGETVGYRVRMDSKAGPQTRIEFITEGVFTRMILDNPDLANVGCVCFDEFHERNLEGDLGLALALDVQNSLREDLRLLPMSATLDGSSVAAILKNAQVIESRGTNFPVDIRYQPAQSDTRLEDEMAAAIRKALREEEGSLLCFLPGQGEIQRTIERLDHLPENVRVFSLYGAMNSSDQQAAIVPAEKSWRKVVLATNIAQTSLTIDGVTVVIDSGLARVSRHEPSTGLNRLQTVRASKAAIHQRAGRAGRTRSGICIRLWHEGQTAALPEQDWPEILDSELSGLVLDLADWGVGDPTELSWLDHPPLPAWDVACKTLQSIGAIDGEKRITETGKTIRKMALPPRLAHMVCCAALSHQAETAARLALLITERGAGGRDVDLAIRLENLARSANPVARKIMATAASMAKSNPAPINISASQGDAILSTGALLSLAWPERIARRMGPAPAGTGREGEMQYLLANGRRAVLDSVSPLAREEWLAICETQGSAAAARILSAAAIKPDEIEKLHEGTVISAREVTLDATSGLYRAKITRRLGSILLSTKPADIEPEDGIAEKTIRHIRSSGLENRLAEDDVAHLRGRLALLHSVFPDRFRPVDDESLLVNLEEWLLPLIPASEGPGDITPGIIAEGLRLYAGYEHMAEIDRLAPARITLPSGRVQMLDYSSEAVTLRARVQEFFGLTDHPAICDGRIGIVLEFLSPAMRPIQKTLDINGFWSGSWQDVRKDMRGRYPKHYWPENPAVEKATTKVRP